MNSTFDIQISFYKSAYEETSEPISYRQVVEMLHNETLQQYITELRKMDKKDYDKEKCNLPCITPSGLFENAHNLQSLREYSNIVSLDFDDLPNAKETLKQISNNEFVFVAFVSPSGNGVKAFVYVEPYLHNNLDAYHKHNLKQVTEYFFKTYGIENDYEKTKDITRLCFLGDSSGIHVNENAQPFVVPTQYRENPVRVVETGGGVDTLPSPQRNPSMPLGDIARVLDDVSPDDYAVWRNVGFALAHEYGSDGLDIFIKWSKKSSKFKSNEDCEKVFRDKPVKNPVTLGTVLAYAKQPPKRQLEPRHDLWNTKDLKRTDKECLLNNLALQRGEIMMLNAATGVGKSVFAFQLASYFYMGRETCGLQPNGTMNVMVIEGEDTIYTVRRKMLGVTQFFTPQEREQVIKNANVFFFKGKCGATFLNSLEDHIIEYKPDFVIVNPIAKFFGGNMIDPEQVSHFMGSLETIAEKYNLGMLLIGHFKKQSKKSQEEGLETAYAGFGSAKWGDSAREVMSLRKVNDKVFELATSKRSWECGFKSITLLQSSSSELPFWEHVTDIKRLYDIQTNQKENPNVKKIINAMPPNGGKTTYSELSKRTGLSQPTIRKWKKSAGIVTEERDGIETQLWIEPCNLKNPEKP